MTSDRRQFLKKASIAAAAVAGGAHPVSGQPPANSHALHAPLLAALADSVLPESLGAAGRARAVRSFSAWLAGYRPVSEEMHGYGNQEITYTGPDPAPGWNAQLEALDTLAHRRFRRGFGLLDVEKRRSLIRSQLDDLREGVLPSSPLAASNVALALLAHWADSSEATDLAYGARIAKDNCRLLRETSREPLPLAPQGTE